MTRKSQNQPSEASQMGSGDAFDLDTILRLFAAHTDDFVTAVDRDGRFTYVNAAAAGFFGLPPGECLGRTLFDFVHADDRDRTRGAFLTWLARGDTQAVSFENRLESPAGDVRHCRWSVLPLRSPGGAPAGLLALARDVTRRARDGAAPAQGEARARAVYAAMLDPMISIDVFGTILAASDSVERVFGYRPDELVGTNVRVLMPEPHHSAHDGYLANYRRTGHTTILGRTRDFEVTRKDGSRIVCGLSVSRADVPGGPPVFTGAFRDVTDQRRAEAALRESELRFHGVFDQVYQYVGLLRPDGTVLEVNRTALDAIGSQRSDVVGRPFWEARWWSRSEGLRERVRDAVARAAGGEFVRFEIEVRGRDQAVRDVDFSLKPVRDEHGDVVLLIPEGRDISELKRAQMAETSMLRALASVGESAAVLAHEIKNPITAVNVALRAVADQLGEDHQEVLNDLVKRMQRLQQLMRGTLSFAKPIQLRLAPCGAAQLLGDAVSSLRTQVAASGSDVRVEVVPPDLELVADAQLLEEVLSNLVVNALEAKKAAARIVLLAAREAAGGVLLAVEDDGPGIPAAVRATLFKPFASTKRDGTGLGLAICRKIVEEHGGRIDVTTGRLGGARFEIRLPQPGPGGLS